MTNELKINARGLDNPGPRMLVETALSKGKPETIRVVVTSEDAVEDLKKFFKKLKAKPEIDRIGDEYHILVSFKKKPKK